ncbi:MAG TPA: hypothetical protein VHW00_05625 [Thermoanaerobaculia bacterium]|nr:hypothetical protein [Thermoanaerobaculia bacterium]
MSRNAILLGLSLWLALLLVTHRGPHSPYSYALQPEGVPNPRYVGGDAPSVVPVTRFLYDGTIPSFARAHNLHLPMHSFSASVVTAFIRKYDVANDITNLLFLLLLAAAALRAADKAGLNRGAQFFGMATMLVLPPVVGFIGQPMHYIVGPVVNYLIILAAMTADDEQLRNPWFAGALTAILSLSYDWYVLGAALLVYILFVVRLPDFRRIGMFLVIALLPAASWGRFLDWISRGEVSNTIRVTFVGAVIAEWINFLREPFHKPVFPLVATQIGATIAFDQILALIYWPLILVCGIVLWRNRGSETRTRAWILLALLAVFFFLEQMFTAVGDWENNPRRAFPFFFAFAVVYCWAAHVMWAKKAWRITFIALFVSTSLFSFADAISGASGIAPLYTGETIRGSAKFPMQFQGSKIIVAAKPLPEQEVIGQSFPRADVSNIGWEWAVANLFSATMLLVLLLLLVHAGLLPRAVPYATAAVLVVSAAVRFVV